MYFLFSGEGATDLGEGMPGPLIAEGVHFLHGPMALLVDHVVERLHRYSPLETAHCGYLSERRLAERGRELKSTKKALALPGARTAKETRYFFNNARLLSRFAMEKAAALRDEVVAVLFRDSDGTASAERGEWDKKFQSMLDGFAEEGFARGVAMIPKPKSEAWLICALKAVPYTGCEALELRSGNDRSPHSLKRELEGILGERASREKLNALVSQRMVDCDKLQMPSFSAFRSRLELAIAT
jgi:hypothetical protein